MYPCENLCQVVEDSMANAQNKANAVIMEFLTYLQRKDKQLLVKLMRALKSKPLEPIVLLRTKFLADSSVPMSCTRKFYEILEKYQYREEEEILQCISTISSSLEKTDFSFWKRCKWVQDITYNEKTKMYTIISSKGNFPFLPLRFMYEKEYEMIKQVGKKKSTSTNKLLNGYNPSSFENFDYNCHFVTYEFSKLHPEDYAITCVCPNIFSGSYWLHSYNLSYNRAYVIDISNGFVMSVTDFEKLIDPFILDETKGMDIPLRLEQIKREAWPFYERTIHTPLKTLAFYQYDTLSKEEIEKRHLDRIKGL